jgi:hypothetical protein
MDDCRDVACYVSVVLKNQPLSPYPLPNGARELSRFWFWVRNHPALVPPIEIVGYNIGHPYGISRNVGADLCVCPLKCITIPLLWRGMKEYLPRPFGERAGERGNLQYNRFHPATSWHPSRWEP